ncbi:collagen-like exosporium glycoprotein BclA3 [Terrabacter lapilli]|uniref:Collagen-like exosporium glycoprotein BclA3 n=1 Tax=Terrabacter lapilli TaxID=436231 RepID=A0ABN2SST2_9MICO
MRARSALAATAAAVTVFASATSALADTITNRIDTTVDAVAETMPILVGGTGSTVLAVVPTKGDNKNGCNLTGKTTLVVDVASADTSIATVTPSRVTFDSCGDTPTLTVKALKVGSSAITLKEYTNDTGRTFEYAPATFDVNVVAPGGANTPPSVGITGPSDGASYAKGAVPAATCVVADAEDGASSFPAALSAITGPYASDGIGTQTASCSYTDHGTPGLTASGSVTYSIVDNSAPVITSDLTPVHPDGLNGWYRSDVKLTWNVADTESPGSVLKDGCVDQTITSDQAETAYSCSATSAGGSAGPVSVSIKRDATAPTVAFESASGTAGLAGWYVSPVTATFAVTDATSGPAEPLVSASSPAGVEGTNVSIASPEASDVAGNTTPPGAASQSFKIDLNAPTLTYAGATGTAGNNGWFTSAVTTAYTVNDSVSGPAQPTVTASSGAAEGSGVVIPSPAASDVAGNVTPAGVDSRSFKIDLTPPTVAFDSSLGGSYYFGKVPAQPNCVASDSVSGVASCQITGYSSAVGFHTVTATATDVAGNTSTTSMDYTVLAWTMSGFFQPVDMGTVVNTVKAGSTVPLKFRMYSGPTEITDTAAVKSFRVASMPCGVTAPTDDVEITSTGGTVLRFDTTGDQFIQNWQTPKTTGCYKATMTALDGSTISALFKLK